MCKCQISAEDIPKIDARAIASSSKEEVYADEEQNEEIKLWLVKCYSFSRQNIQRTIES